MRFNENKCPSTNIKVKEFLKHLDIIKNNNIKFTNPKNLEKELLKEKSKEKILLTIDDGFLFFFMKVLKPILKKSRSPFILFISTREVGLSNYMNSGSN